MDLTDALRAHLVPDEGLPRQVPHHNPPVAPTPVDDPMPIPPELPTTPSPEEDFPIAPE